MQIDFFGKQLEVDPTSDLPSTDAFRNASIICEKLKLINILPFGIDIDALGGIDLWYGKELNTKDSKRIWISCLNNNATSILYIDNSVTKEAEKFDFEKEFDRIEKFLRLNENTTENTA